MARHRSTITRKNQLMNAARKLIMRSGSEHVTVRDMAKEVGISERAVYRHFKSRTEILAFLADDLSDRLLHDIETARGVGIKSVNVIDEILKTHLSKIKQKRGISFPMLAEFISFGDKHLDQKVSAIIHTYVDRLTRALRGRPSWNC